MTGLKSFFGILFFCFGLILASPLCRMVSAGASDAVYEETMLMFVGEDLEVLSIASRREESAWGAPAVAEVINRKEFVTRGDTTLAQVLEKEPGFHMAEKEWGTRPYLRGIPDSTLFLYDTFPVLSFDVTRSVNPLEHEFSLASVKRIEIIRGPGSVLWGPDAYAGIVNVVPLTGEDLQGVETGLTFGETQEQRGFYANAGGVKGAWDGFLSVSGREEEADRDRYHLARFWGDEETPVPPEDRFEQGRIDRLQFLEASANLSYSDWFSVTARLAKSDHPYVLTDNEGELKWPEGRDTSAGFLKMEAKKELSRKSALRFAGAYTFTEPELRVIDRVLEQKEAMGYGELIYDRSLLSGAGLFTGGVSYREKHVRNAPIWNSYLPDYLGGENLYFLPTVHEEDYATRLWSVFGQYSHKIGDVDFWLGARSDMHDSYQDQVSVNSGLAWIPSEAWGFKLIYGTAYRTPYARQLRGDGEPELEKINSFNGQMAWRPTESSEIKLTGFYSRIDNHVTEDPYAGLSSSNHQYIQGLEGEVHFFPWDNLEVEGNITFMNNHGPRERFRYNDYSFVRPDGTLERHFVDLEYAYDGGPDILANLMGTWRPLEWFSIFLRLGYISEQEISYFPGLESFTIEKKWVTDASAAVTDPFGMGFELYFIAKAIYDDSHLTPGTYNSFVGNPFRFEIQAMKKW